MKRIHLFEREEERRKRRIENGRRSKRERARREMLQLGPRNSVQVSHMGVSNPVPGALTTASHV